MCICMCICMCMYLLGHVAAGAHYIHIHIYTYRSRTVHEPFTNTVHEHRSRTVHELFTNNRSRTPLTNNSNTFTLAVHEQGPKLRSRTVHEQPFTNTLFTNIRTAFKSTLVPACADPHQAPAAWVTYPLHRHRAPWMNMGWRWCIRQTHMCIYLRMLYMHITF